VRLRPADGLSFGSLSLSSNTRPINTDKKAVTKAGEVTGTSHFVRTFKRGKGATMTASGPLDFAKYKRPQFEGPMHKLTRAPAAESDDGEMPAENLSDLLDRVSRNSTDKIDSLIGEFERLRGKLQTDGERIKREIEEY
jgi:hypothetical protein